MAGPKPQLTQSADLAFDRVNQVIPLLPFLLDEEGRQDAEYQADWLIKPGMLSRLADKKR